MVIQEVREWISWSQFPYLSAVQHIRKMRGGTQAHLLRASDGGSYVTKFQNNPQHVRVLVNEFLATKIALSLGLPMPEVNIIEVSEWLIADTPKLRIEIGEKSIPCDGGLQVGSRNVADLEDHVIDHLPESMFANIVNKQDFARVLAFDKWMGNCDGRQAIFIKRNNRFHYAATFIDQGYCFNAGDWTFPDLSLLGTYSRKNIYDHVTSWRDFEPTLSRIEHFDSSELCRLATDVPEEWYQSDSGAFWHLVETLWKRRSIIRELITKFRKLSQNPFPNWTRCLIDLRPTIEAIQYRI